MHADTHLTPFAYKIRMKIYETPQQRRISRTLYTLLAIVTVVFMGTIVHACHAHEAIDEKPSFPFVRLDDGLYRFDEGGVRCYQAYYSGRVAMSCVVMPHE